jgi:hypothetical protein
MLPTIPIHNIHRRVIRAEPDVLGELIDAIATPDDRLWPVHDTVPLKLEGPVAVGVRGGHGPARYEIVGHQPGRWVRFEFTRPSSLIGFHEFSVQPHPNGSVFQHLLAARLTPGLWLGYPLLLRPLHNSVIELALDHAELAGAGCVDGEPVTFGPYVRMLLRGMSVYQRCLGD